MIENHPWTTERLDHGAPTTHEIIQEAGKVNNWLAIKITSGVGTMWCAYAFAILALMGLPQAISDTFANNQIKPLSLIAWTAQTFLQLVLLSIIIVGQNIQSTAADKRSELTYKDAEAILHEVQQIQKQLKDKNDQTSSI